MNVLNTPSEETQERIAIALEKLSPDGKIGNLEDLATEAKTNLVASINEVKERSNENATDITNLKTKTNKTTFNCTPNTDYSIVSSNCYVKDGCAYVNVEVRRAVVLNFDVKLHSLLTVPHKPLLSAVPITCTGRESAGMISELGKSYITSFNKLMAIDVITPGIGSIFISTSYEI